MSTEDDPITSPLIAMLALLAVVVLGALCLVGLGLMVA